jgi:hypothetical protein
LKRLAAAFELEPISAPRETDETYFISFQPTLPTPIANEALTRALKYVSPTRGGGGLPIRFFDNLRPSTPEEGPQVLPVDNSPLSSKKLFYISCFASWEIGPKFPGLFYGC